MINNKNKIHVIILVTPNELYNIVDVLKLNGILPIMLINNKEVKKDTFNCVYPECKYHKL